MANAATIQQSICFVREGTFAERSIVNFRFCAGLEAEDCLDLCLKFSFLPIILQINNFTESGA